MSIESLEGLKRSKTEHLRGLKDVKSNSVPDAMEIKDSDGKKGFNESKVQGIGTDLTYKHEVLWLIVLVYVVLHIWALVGLVLCLSGSVKMSTMVWSLFYYVVGLEGVTMGAHRYFSHKSFQIKTPLKCIILLMQVSAGQGSAYLWSRTHRQHHRYSDTDGDPHNANRGFVFSHIGWLVTKRSPLCKALRSTIDMTDLHQDRLVMFQYNYYRPLYFAFGFLLPVWVPTYFFEESLTNAFFVSYALRYMLVLNSILCVNSVAHMWGTKPYDKNIEPVESGPISLLTLGEGWHNFHHAFPWDYRAAETHLPFQMTTFLIEFCKSIGMAYDLKSVSGDVLKKRMMRTGDGTRDVKE